MFDLCVLQYNGDLCKKVRTKVISPEVFAVMKKKDMATEERKEANRRKHSKPGTVPNISEREAHTVEEKE